MNKSRVGSEYIPLVEGDMLKARFVLDFAKLAWFTVSLPFFAFIFCIIWSIVYDFEHSTSTHCKVFIFLICWYQILRMFFTYLHNTQVYSDFNVYNTMCIIILFCTRFITFYHQSLLLLDITGRKEMCGKLQ